MRAAPHRFLVALLLSLATLATIAGIGARWLENEILSTGGWTQASSRLFDDGAVRRALAGYAVDQAFTAGGIDEALEHSLGSVAGGAAATRLRLAAQPVATRVLRTRAARRAWRRANRRAQAQLLRAIDHSGDDRPVVLDTGPIVTEVLTSLAATSVAQAIPGAGSVLSAAHPGAGRLTVLEPGQARPLRRGVDTVRTLAWALWAIAAALFVGALALASGRRAATLSRIGYRLIGAGAIVLVVRWLAQYPFADTVSSLGIDRAGLRAGWLSATTDLRALAVGVLVVGAVVALVSFGARLLAR